MIRVIEAEGEGALETVIVTGLSGAGRSTAAKCLEDLGYFVVDNLPPALLVMLFDLSGSTPGTRSGGAGALRGDGITRLAVVMDVRSRAFSSDLREVVRSLADQGKHARVIFLEASDAVLVRRFESNRRPHPLQGDGRLVDGIEAERELLRGLRDDADLIIDTSRKSVHELRHAIEAALVVEGGVPAPELRANIVSFGFKYGLPLDSDLVVDVRFLPNPHWIPELRELTGTDAEVRDYVMAQKDASDFLSKYTEILEMIGAGYRRESKRYLTLAVGCTGGKHRSVAMAEEFAERLRATGVQTTVTHRDLGRE
jgi:UPF0042 nucleotide-binding protein